MFTWSFFSGSVLFLFLVFCVVFVDLVVLAFFLMLSVSLHCHCWLPFGFLNVCLTTYKFEQSLHFDTPTTPTKEEILYKHMYVCCSVGMWTKDEELDLPSLLDSKITQFSYILLGLPTAPPKPLSKSLTCILSAVKTGVRVTATLATQGVMWIRYGLSSCNIIKPFDISCHLFLINCVLFFRK